MANKKQAKPTKKDANAAPQGPASQDELMKKLPKEAQEKLKKIKTKLNKFSKQVTSKFEKYVVGIALLPPPKPQEQMPEGAPAPKEAPNPDQISTLVLIDDSEPTKMSKFELKDKLTAIIDNVANTVNEVMFTMTCFVSSF